MARFIGIDVGTTGCKAIVVDEAGHVLASASEEYALSVPRPKWSEQDPEDWWRAAERCLARLDCRDPDAVGLTGQMHGSVFLDAHDQVIRPAILWNDQRTVAECDAIDRLVGADRVRAITCNPPVTGFQAPKILWLRTHEPDAMRRVRRVLLPKDYVRLRLTGDAATDVSDASGTGLFDVGERTWSAEMLGGLDLEPAWFPRAFESDEQTGATLAGSVPVVAGGGDQAAAAVGTGAVAPGVLSVSLGTSGVVFGCVDGPGADARGSAHVFCHANRGWHAMGVTLACGGSLRWFRDALAAGTHYDAIAAEAASVEPGALGLTFLPYLSGERCPHNAPDATGGFLGLTLAHTRAHLARSVFEGATFALRDARDLLAGLGANTREVRVTGGGAQSAFWTQLVADVFEAPCATLEADEGPALGAALLAGVGVGAWNSVHEAAEACVRIARVVEPSGTDYSAALANYRERAQREVG